MITIRLFVTKTTLLFSNALDVFSETTLKNNKLQLVTMSLIVIGLVLLIIKF